ncbi:MAG: hypothetical protein HYT80_08375 [Euryarchaeota archaeon]|nr:hypothetical protein [Euryarchaeota archaeon]
MRRELFPRREKTSSIPRAYVGLGTPRRVHVKTMNAKTMLIAASVVALAGVSAVPSVAAETIGNAITDCQDEIVPFGPYPTLVHCLEAKCGSEAPFLVRVNEGDPGCSAQ